MIFGFAEYKIDLERRELRNAETLVHVEPQVFDLLVYLLENRDRVVSKDDLIGSVWGDRIVSESTLTSRVVQPARPIHLLWRRRLRSIHRAQL